MWGEAHSTAHVRVRGQLQEAGSLLQPSCGRGKPDLGDKGLCLLSHLTGLTLGFNGTTLVKGFQISYLIKVSRYLN